MDLKYTNSNGIAVILRDRPPYFLTKLDGTGNLRNVVTSFKAPTQDGSFFVGSALDMRDITIEGTIVAGGTDEAYALRQRLLQVFTPKLQGTLQYRSRRIACVVEDVKLIVTTKQRYPTFLVSLLCPSPYFEALYRVREDLALWQPLFEFPLEITGGVGIEMGRRQPSQILTLLNVGDTECGCEIVFSALGAVTNPELLNLLTGAYIRVNTTMEAGEEIHVYTHFASKRVTSVLRGVASNIFYLLDTGSTFLQFAVGANTLRYDAEDGLDLLGVTLYYSPLYLGV
jgi:hypothetical protein